MANEVFDFLWSVPEDGYRWAKAEVLMADDGKAPARTRRSQSGKRTQWVLTDDLAVGTPYALKQYSPLKLHPALFRTFAQLPLENRDAILAFANTYGNLGINRMLNLHAPEGPSQLLAVWGETHQDWVRCIDQMRRAIFIWDMVQSRDVAGLSRFLRWKEGEYEKDGRTVKRTGGWYYDSHPDLPRGEAIPPPGRVWQLIEPVMDLFKPGDVLMPAVFLVQRWANDHLKGQTAPRLLYDLDRGMQVLRIAPENLLSAMWLQLAESISGNKNYRACRECGRWFEVSSDDDGRTARRVFCDDPCKSRDYRRRRERAQQLKMEGNSVKDIAKELDTDVETIKKWVTKRRR